MKLFLVLALGLVLADSAMAMNCKKGKPCGKACFAMDKECHITSSTKECKKGKPCGDTCIAADKQCNK